MMQVQQHVGKVDLMGNPFVWRPLALMQWAVCSMVVYLLMFESWFAWYIGTADWAILSVLSYLFTMAVFSYLILIGNLATMNPNDGKPSEEFDCYWICRCTSAASLMIIYVGSLFYPWTWHDSVHCWWGIRIMLSFITVPTILLESVQLYAYYTGTVHSEDMRYLKHAERYIKRLLKPGEHMDRSPTQQKPLHRVCHKLNICRRLCSSGVELVPAIFAMGMVSTIVFLVVMFLEAHFYFVASQTAGSPGLMRIQDAILEQNYTIREVYTWEFQHFVNNSNRILTYVDWEKLSEDTFGVPLSATLEENPDDVMAWFDRTNELYNMFWGSIVRSNITALCVGLFSYCLMIDRWEDVWRDTRRGLVRGSNLQLSEKPSHAMTFIGYSIGNCFFAYWIVFAFAWMVRFEPMWELITWGLGWQQCFYGRECVDKDYCDMTAGMGDTAAALTMPHKRTADIEEWCQGGDWFASAFLVYLVDRLFIRTILVDTILTDRVHTKYAGTLSFVMWMTTIYYSVVSLAVICLRMILYILFWPITAFRTDRTFFPSILWWLDDIYLSHASLAQVVNHRHNPVVRVAIRVLSHRITDWELTGVERQNALAAKDQGNRKSQSFLRARTRWQLAYTLMKNPGLRIHRPTNKHFRGTTGEAKLGMGLGVRKSLSSRGPGSGYSEPQQMLHSNPMQANQPSIPMSALPDRRDDMGAPHV